MNVRQEMKFKTLIIRYGSMKLKVDISFSQKSNITAGQSLQTLTNERQPNQKLIDKTLDHITNNP